jgi:hypothetical protein
MPTLELQPELIEVLRKRFPAAVARVWDADVIRAGDSDFNDRPGRHREHVFDLWDGGHLYRLIVSVESLHGGRETVLHVSCSSDTGRHPTAQAFATANRLFARVAGLDRPPEWVTSFTSPGGVAHLIHRWPLERSE